MKLPRREFLQLLGGATALQLFPRAATAQAYPSRPVHLIVGFPAGGPVDLTARIIGQWLSGRLGQPFVVENRAGAGGNIGTEAVVKAASDGYTLLMCGPVNTINSTLYDNLPFDFSADISPVASVVRVPLVLEVNPSVPVKTVPELIAYIKANPGKVNMGSGGNGTPQHISGELFKMMAGVSLLHVPYRGSAPALTDLLGGQIQMMFDPMPSSIEHIRSGKLRALAVTTAKRSDLLPNVPSLGDFLPGYETGSWYGVGAPRNTPVQIVEMLNKEINIGLADGKVRARLEELGGTEFPGSTADFAKFIADETDKWGKVIRAGNIKAG